jgi:hypothetical protein
MSDLDDAFRWQEIQNRAAMQRAQQEADEISAIRAELYRLRGERAAVVRYLRRYGDWRPGLLDAIERGEHLKDEPK